MFDYDDLSSDEEPAPPKNSASAAPSNVTEPVKARDTSPAQDRGPAPTKAATVVSKAQAKPKLKAVSKPQPKAKSSLEDRLSALARAEAEQGKQFMQMMAEPKKSSPLDDRLAALGRAEAQQGKQFMQMMAAPKKPPEPTRPTVEQAAASPFKQRALPEPSFQQPLHSRAVSSGSKPASPPRASALLKPPSWICKVDAKWRLPSLEFLVMESASAWRCSSDEVMELLQPGSLLTAVEETFDGWLRMVRPFDGWVLNDSRLDPLGAPELLAASSRAPRHGAQEFEVTAGTGVEVFMEPSTSASVRSMTPYGAVVLAETQTYNGWIRLADGEGWMQSRSHACGELLSCVYMRDEHRRNRVLYQQKQERAEREAAAEATLAEEIERSRKSDVWSKLAADADASEQQGDSDSRIARPAYHGIHKQKMDTDGIMNERTLFKFRPEGTVFQGLNNLSRWNYNDLPVQEFRIVNADPLVRSEPRFSGQVCGQLTRGNIVQAFEETFDGWVKLADQPGWAPRDMGGRDGIQECLQEICRPALAAVPDFVAGGPSRMMFEVVFEPRVDILREPQLDAPKVGSRGFGEFVLAEAQTYHGWLRLADDLGWMLCVSQRHGQLLSSVSAAEHAAPMMALDGPGEAVPSEEEQRAREREEKEKEILRQVENQERQEALEELEAAAASGDGAIFRAATKAAKQAGVNKKDIARLHALFTAGS